MAWIARGETVLRGPREGPKALASGLLAIALLVWGTGYLIAAIPAPTAAARVFDGNLTGSTHPIAAWTDWLAAGATLGSVGVLAWAWVPARAREPMLALSSVALLLLVLEGTARAKAHVAPVPQGFPTYSGELWRSRYVQFNSMGFRDREHSLTRTRGERRVLIVGDSYALGVGIEDPADRFGEHLARLLEEGTGEEWVAFHASRGNTHTRHHIAFLERMSAFRADLVVLLHVANDFDYLRRVAPGALDLAQISGLSSRLHPVRLAYTNSYLFQEIFIRVRLLLVGADAVETVPHSVLRRNLDDVMAFETLARSLGAAVVLIPFDVSVVELESARSRYRRFIEMAGSLGLQVCSLETAFDRMSLDRLVINRLDAHPNERANELAARHAAPCVLSAI